MSKKIVIRCYPNNLRVLKAQFVGLLNGVSVEYAQGFEMGKSNKEDSFLAVNPFGQVPTGFTEDGKEGVFESNSIARYAARLGESTRPLYGKNALEASRIDAFLDVEMGISSAASDWFAPLMGYGTADEAKTKASKERVKKILLGFDRHLAHHQYLVGDSISLADAVLLASSLFANTMAFDEEYLKDVPHYKAWFDRMSKTKELEQAVNGAIATIKERFKK